MDTITGRIIETRRLGISPNSTVPRYAVQVVTRDGYAHTFRLAPRIALNFAIGNREYREQVHTFTIDRHGNIARATLAN